MARLEGGTTIAGFTALHSGLQNAFIGGNLTLSGNVVTGGARGVTVIGTTNYGTTPIVTSDDRPGINLVGAYPDINLITGVNNSNHGGVLRFTSYDDDTRAAWKNWVVGTAGRNAIYMDFGYSSGTETNPHAGISQWAGSGTGVTILRLNNTGHVGLTKTNSYLYGPDNSNFGINNASVTQWIRPQDGGGNLHIKATAGNVYIDTGTLLVRDVAGAENFTATLDGIYLKRGWFRAYGNNGLYLQDRDLGWWSDDASWMKNYNHKGLWLDGRMQVASRSFSNAYSSAPIEVREYNFEGAVGTNVERTPRISFHWAGYWAAQIGIGTGEFIRTYNNPGNGYCDFKAANIYMNDAIVASSARMQVPVVSGSDPDWGVGSMWIRSDI